jgi:hypothetical protein
MEQAIQLNLFGDIVNLDELGVTSGNGKKRTLRLETCYNLENPIVIST